MSDHAEDVREFYRQQGKAQATGNYTRGFRAGQRNERDALIEYLSIHIDHGTDLTMEEIVEEIHHWDKLDMDNNVMELMNGRLAQQQRMGEG